MAEEDILFGKNRHLFGGIAPSNMLRFTAKRDNVNNRVEITCELPAETIIDGQVICTVAGAVIRKSTEGYPVTEFDGELLADVTASGTICDVGVSPDVNVYYSAFPYSKMGVYNRNQANRTEVGQFPGKYLFGYDMDMSDSDPSTRITYPDDVHNNGFTPAKMNYTSGAFEYGDWPSTPGEYFMPKPCMLKYDGTVDYYLNPDNYKQKEDGTSSDVASTSYEGNAMIEWPKIYTKRWKDDDGVYHFRCSDIKVEDDWDCWCNYDKNNNEIDHFYTAIYDGYHHTVSGSKRIRSLSGVTAVYGYSMESAMTYAQANGTDWTMDVLSDRLLINDLLVMMAKTTDGQTAYGRGCTNTSDGFASGFANTKGLFWGSTSTAKGIKVFGMENWWGYAARFVAGLIEVSGNVRVKLTRGKHDGSTVTEYNSDGTGYVKCFTFSSERNGYVKTMYVAPFGVIPQTTGGSSSTYECDMMIYIQGASDDPYVGTFGLGYYSSNDDNVAGAANGPFNVRINTSAYNEMSITKGTTLSCKPSKT